MNSTIFNFRFYNCIQFKNKGRGRNVCACHITFNFETLNNKMKIIIEFLFLFCFILLFVKYQISKASCQQLTTLLIISNEIKKKMNEWCNRLIIAHCICTSNIKCSLRFVMFISRWYQCKEREKGKFIFIVHLCY